MDNRKINVEEAKQQITELKNVREEIEKLVNELESQFLAEFSDAYDSQRAQELKANIDAMKSEIETINKETNTITQISEEYVRSSEATDTQ